MTGKNNKITGLSVIDFTPKFIASDIKPSEVNNKHPRTTMYEVEEENGRYWMLTVLAYFNSEFKKEDFKYDTTGEDIMYRDIVPLYTLTIYPDRDPMEPVTYTLWEFSMKLNTVDYRAGILLSIDENIGIPTEPERGTVTMPHPTE